MMEIAPNLTTETRMRRARSHVLFAYAVLFAIWQTADLLAGIFSPAKFLRLLAVVAGFLWSAALVRILWLQRVISKDKALESAVQDELVQHHRSRSFVVGYWTMLATLGIVLFATGAGVHLSLDIAARVPLVLGVTVPLLVFAIQERE